MKRSVLILIMFLSVFAQLKANIYNDNLVVPMSANKNQSFMYRKGISRRSDIRTKSYGSSIYNNRTPHTYSAVNIHKVSSAPIKSYGGYVVNSNSSVSVSSATANNVYNVGSYSLAQVPTYKSKTLSVGVSKRRVIEWDDEEQRWWDTEEEDYVDESDIKIGAKNADGWIWNGSEFVKPATEVGEDVPLGDAEWWFLILLPLLYCLAKSRILPKKMISKC